MAVNNEYVNRVDANGQTLIDLTNDTAEAEDVLEGQTFHLRSGAPAVGTYRPSDEIEARLKATVGHSSKNLLKIVADSQTINGVTFTVDKTAGTITASGQVEGSSTAQFDFIPRQPIDSRINGLILTEPTSVTTPNYGLRTSIAYYNASNQFISEQTINSGRPDPIVVSLPSGAASYKVYVRVSTYAGALNNVVIKPMLREASISDDTFEPYVTPTDEKKQDKPVELDPSVLTWNIDDLISQYAYLQFVFMDMQSTSSRLFDIATVPTSQFMNLPVTQPSHVFGFSSIIAIRALGSTTGTSYITFYLNSDGTIEMSDTYTPLAPYLTQVIGIPN